jgi:hypothetical protein
MLLELVSPVSVKKDFHELLSGFLPDASRRYFVSLRYCLNTATLISTHDLMTRLLVWSLFSISILRRYMGLMLDGDR